MASNAERHGHRGPGAAAPDVPNGASFRALARSDTAAAFQGASRVIGPRRGWASGCRSSEPTASSSGGSSMPQPGRAAGLVGTWLRGMPTRKPSNLARLARAKKMARPRPLSGSLGVRVIDPSPDGQGRLLPTSGRGDASRLAVGVKSEWKGATRRLAQQSRDAPGRPGVHLKRATSNLILEALTRWETELRARSAHTNEHNRSFASPE